MLCSVMNGVGNRNNDYDYHDDMPIELVKHFASLYFGVSDRRSEKLANAAPCVSPCNTKNASIRASMPSPQSSFIPATVVAITTNIKRITNVLSISWALAAVAVSVLPNTLPLISVVPVFVLVPLVFGLVVPVVTFISMPLAQVGSTPTMKA